MNGPLANVGPWPSSADYSLRYINMYRDVNPTVSRNHAVFLLYHPDSKHNFPLTRISWQILTNTKVWEISQYNAPIGQH